MYVFEIVYLSAANSRHFYVKVINFISCFLLGKLLDRTCRYRTLLCLSNF